LALIIKCNVKPMIHCVLSCRQPQSTSSSRMRVMNYNWSATKQRIHPQSRDKPPFSFVRGQDSTM